MCGIFGIVTKRNSLSPTAFKAAMRKLFKLSESRGKESSGLAWWQDNSVVVYKDSTSATRMLRSPRYKDVEKKMSWRSDEAGNVALIGHCRLVTNGLEAIHYNNQPVIRNHCLAVHNGIITNDNSLWEKIKNDCRRYDVDTEVFLALLEDGLVDQLNLINVWQQAYAHVEGSVSIAVMHTNLKQLVMATDNGSLYMCHNMDQSFYAFASEKRILQAMLKIKALDRVVHGAVVKQISPGTGQVLDLEKLQCKGFSLVNGEISELHPGPPSAQSPEIHDLAALSSPENANMRRCTRCILPESMPFINFDEKGVCNTCREHIPRFPMGEDALLTMLESYRRDDGGYDCLVGFSGGRDSSYGLHLLKSKFGMNPVAFTYDWGMVTDLARRNIYRICGRLGIEHILVSANIRKKRENVRRNIKAWLKQPDLGIVPLFMAGDKQFYYHSKRIMKKMGIKLMIFCENGKFERAHFKSGFCGIDEGARRAFNINLFEKAKIALYYLSRFIQNPSYLNRSILDSLTAFYSTYMLRHDYLFLFEYIDWNEKVVEKTLIDEYNWETSPETPGTWRIGDGTTPFYNYIYYTMAGFTENDTFRSNQIRYGVISREEALSKSREENKLRLQSMEWYANKIGFDLNEALCIINAAPKQYFTYDLCKLLKDTR
jgi:glucosamine--fructose-6-phosphate aminotransferase (isomerizing)